MTSRTTALIYVRVSRLDRTDRQKIAEGKGDELRAMSPKTQMEQCKALPALHGLRSEVIEDLHRSGKNTNRPGLDELLKRIEDPDVAVVAVWSISRLARSVPDLYELLERFNKVGVAFVSAKESIDTSNAYGRAFLGFLAVLAQFERELTGERLTANLAQRAFDGHLVGPLPAGYTRNKKGDTVIDESRAIVVRSLFEEYATGKHSIDSLARWANERRLKPPQRWRGKVARRDTPVPFFTHDSVYDLLTNMRYAGRFVHASRRNPHGDVIQGKFSAIISPDLWDRCAEIRRKGRKLLRGDKRVTRYALTGLLLCGTCGDNVRGDTMGSGRRRYLCRGRNETRLCTEPQALADALEAEVQEWLNGVRVAPAWQQAYSLERAKGNGVPKTRTLEQRLQTIERKIEMKRVSWEAGAYKAEAAYRQEVAALRAEMEALRSAPELPLSRQAATIDTLADRWEEMRPDQRKRLLATVFDEMTVKGGRLDTARPKAGWQDYFEHVIHVPPVELRGVEPLTS